jgi:hypothetical protein
VTEKLLEKFTEKSLAKLRLMTPRQALHVAIDDYLFLVDDVQDVIIFWYQETRNLQPSQRKRLFRIDERCAEVFKTMLAWGCESGVFTIDNVNLVAHNIVVLCDMWAFRRWMTRRNYTLNQYKRIQSDFVCEAICRGSG